MGGLSRANLGLRGSVLHIEESESRSSLSLFVIILKYNSKLNNPYIFLME